MSHATTFHGKFNLAPKLTAEQVKYLTKFARTRRMKRDEFITERMPDPIRNAVNLPIGWEAQYYVGSQALMGQDCNPPSVVHPNEPPSNQPSLYCQWIPSQDGEFIEWDGNDSFNYPTEWLNYLIEDFFTRWAITVNGCVEWRGEKGDETNTGTITVVNNSYVVLKKN